ncbi:MAG: PqqD family protein [Abditibacteriota bacterium]|nr:PqqD family protein [Abditibacteriota bacterium]
MKLKQQFLTQEIEDTTFLVPVGRGSFGGLIRSNRTAAFIAKCLTEDTTRDGIVDAMCRKYDAPREVIADGVDRILDILRSIDALEE